MKNFKSFLWLLCTLGIFHSFAQDLPSIPEVIQQAQHSVYKITKKDIPGNGTVFFISPTLFVTNFHGVGSLNLEDEKFDEIQLYQQEQLSPLKIKQLVAISALFDLAILETHTPVDSYLAINGQAPTSYKDLFTIGYPHNTLIIQKKTGNLLNWEHNYCFLINQSAFEDSNGSSGSPVLNQQGEVAGVIYSGIFNLQNSINPDKIEQLIANEIGTNCTHFDNIKSCIDNELNFVENEIQQGNGFAQYLGAIQWSISHKSRLLYNMIQSLNNMTVEEQDQFLTEMDNQFHTLDAQTLHWNTLSAQQGYAPAQYALGLSHYTREHMEPDLEQAFYWIKTAAEQGYAPAQYMLNIFYHDGEGSPKNSQQAINWLIQSAHQGYMPAQLELAATYSIGDDIEAKPLKAFQWYKKSAQEGSKIAQFILAITYMEGDGVQKNWNEAFYWMKQSAEQNYADAQSGLATMYYNGDGTEKNVEQAFYWTHKAAEQGDLESQFRLFVLYHNGEGVAQDIEQAHQWLETAAEGGHKDAQEELKEHFESNSPIIDWIKGLFSDS